jgi:hypothetical protein
MLRIRKQGCDRRIGLAGTQFEISVFGVPAGEGGVMLRDGLIRIGSRARGGFESK